ncbi:MAG: hypothetical protein ACJ74Q_15365 [Pyrinomonadaceae bacterium]
MENTPTWFQIAVLIVIFLAGCGVGATWMFIKLTPPKLNSTDSDEQP